MNKITLSDVLKKHLKIVGYLAASSALAYVGYILTNKPEAMYFMPVINYVMYAVTQELKKEGFTQAMK